MKKILTMLIVGFFAASLTGCPQPHYTDEELIEMYSFAGAFIPTDSETGFLTFAGTESVIEACVVNTVSQQYRAAALFALSEFDRLDGIDLMLSIEPVCNPNYYDIVFDIYNDNKQDICSDDDSDVVACNSFQDNGDYITYSKISFNTNIMDDMDESWVRNVAVHELGHAFGLNDLEQAVFEELSIMYYATGTIVLTTLTEWDIANLEWAYGGNE